MMSSGRLCVGGLEASVTYLSVITKSDLSNHSRCSSTALGHYPSYNGPSMITSILVS